VVDDREIPPGVEESAAEVLDLFASRPSARLSFQQIASGLEGEHPRLSEAVELLVERGSLRPAGGGRYALPEQLGIFRGRIVMRSDGSGFVKFDGGRLEIDRRNTGGALDRDTVFAKKLQQIDEDTFGGKVMEVAERSRKGLSGVVRKRGHGWVIDPVDPVLPRNLPLRTGRGEPVSQGRLVYAELDYGSHRPTAVLKRNLGRPGSPEALIDAVAMDHGLPGEFPGDMEELASRKAGEPWSLEGREDLRELLTITVDPVDARDFDDAVSYAEEDGTRILYVHIADVAAYVAHGSPLDSEASSRGTSVYLPDRVIPMLPQVLSNGACSLRPGEDRPARTVIMKFDDTGKRKDFSILPSAIRSDSRMTYEEALEYLRGGGGDPRLKLLFTDLGRLSADLDRVREERGALEIQTSEYRVEFDEDGWPGGFLPVPSDESHRMIENFMVEANRAVADHCTWTGLPVLYRVHEEPAEKSIERLEQELDRLEVRIPGGRIRSPSGMRALLLGIESRALRDLVSEHVLRSLRKAVYMAGNLGHFGLALRSYMHFTSPIRRYPDLLVHQMLSMQEKGLVPAACRPVSDMAESASYREDNAESAERDAVELMALLYLSRMTGSVHDGVVTGVKRFGIFVRLEDVPVEGLAHSKDIRRSGIPFHGPGGIFHEGSQVRVKVLSVDVMERKLSLITVRE